MTKDDLITSISKQTGLTKTDVSLVVEGFLDSIKFALKKGDVLEIRGFGTFLMQKRSARVGRNPLTGKRMEIPPKVRPFLRFSKKLLKEVG